MRLRIAKIRAKAATRPVGYIEDVLSSGIMDGEHLEIAAETLATLRDKYRPPAPARRLTPSTASDHEKQGHISGCCDSALNP